MIRYKVSFVYSEPIYLTSDQFGILSNALYEKPEAKVFMIDEQIPFLQIDMINFIQREEINDATSGIIKPPTPADLRDQREKDEANKDLSLDAQLAGEV